MFVYKKWIVMAIGGTIKMFGKGRKEGDKSRKGRRKLEKRAMDEKNERNSFQRETENV
jgi:hypothetical protein